MKNKFLIGTLKIIAVSAVALYLLFLGLPLVLNSAVKSYIPQIVKEIKKTSGLDAEIDTIRLVTTPKLTAGLKVKKLVVKTPDSSSLFEFDDFSVKMSLISLLSKKIEIDAVNLADAQIILKVNKDGSFDIEKYIPQTQEEQSESEKNTQTEIEPLPFGLKLSDKLPDIHIGKYTITITDGTDKYAVFGNKTDITDFIFNKSVKLKGSGNVILKGREHFVYEFNVLNKIMSKTSLHDTVFAPAPLENAAVEPVNVNILQILEGLSDCEVTANAVVDLKTDYDNIDGSVDFSNVSVLKLPESNANLKFKGKTIDIVSEIYTAKNESSTINGRITSGDKPFADINVKSGLELENLLNIIKKVALIFNINDLKTLSANGKIDADFNIKSDMKTVQSSGYLKVPSAKVYYGLYDIGIDNINADVALDDNNVNIKNAGFSVFGQPLKLSGTIDKDALCDIKLSADKLSLKGLLIAFGQSALLKENNVNSGYISADVIAKGKIDTIKPVVKLDLGNINIKNVPSDLTVKVPSVNVDINSDGKTFEGNASGSNIMLINPAATVSIPSISADIKENMITISDTPVTVEKIKTSVSGKISDYLTEKISLDFKTTGDLKSVLKGDVNLNKQILYLVFSTTDLSTIIIPGFDKSKMSFNAKIDITGNMMNPDISGTVSLPEISIPEIPVKMTETELKLKGVILNGSATVKNFENGGIKAQNIASDFSLKGNDFYLNNLTGTAFSGQFNGNVIYNIVNAKTSVDFSGKNMDAEKAIEGAAGIKKALTGTLGFDTRLKLTVGDYNDMMKSMTGDLNFDVKNGSFGSLGSLDGFLKADNIVTNSLLKNTVSALSGAASITDAAKFDVLDGNLTFSNGIANINPVKSAGKALCYYITGKYNLINGTTNVNILGRLDASTVSKLGAFGELSADKFLSYIPIFGDSTAKLLNSFTSDPANEKTELIPQLTGENKNYKDFKIVFNGGVDSSSSVKSFKWLSKPDTSSIQTQSLKETVKNVQSSLNTDVKAGAEKLNSAVETKKKEIAETKEQLNQTKQQLKDSAGELKNLFKSVTTQNSGTSSGSAE